MLHESVKAYIRSLSNEELIAYAIDLKSGYAPEAMEFAGNEALSRGIPDDQAQMVIRSVVLAKEKILSEAVEGKKRVREAPARFAMYGFEFGICAAIAVWWALLSRLHLYMGFIPAFILALLCAFLFAVIGYIVGSIVKWSGATKDAAATDSNLRHYPPGPS